MGVARGYRWLPGAPGRAGKSAAPRHDGAVDALADTTDGGGGLPARLDEPSAELEPAPAPNGPQRPWFRRIDPKLLLASIVIAVGLTLIGVALSRAVTGNEAANLPAAIESITPTFDASQVPQQTAVIADLAAGYEGRLIVDDVALPTIRQDEVVSPDIKPGEQVKVPPGVLYEPGNATLTFTPGDDQAIKRFDAGSHTVVVVYWKIVEGERTARSYMWSFTTV
jgi:hypothetical protein